MKKQNYSEQIKSPKWQKKRLEVLNLRGFKCEECGDEEQQLHIHHRFYIKNRMAWEYDNDVFQVLCSDCHEMAHNEKKNGFSLSFEEKMLIECLRKVLVLNDTNIKYLHNIMNEYLKKHPKSEFLKYLFYTTTSGDFERIVSEVAYMGVAYDKKKELIDKLEKTEKELRTIKTKKNG